MTEPRLQSHLGFRVMSLLFRLRDWLRPPAKILSEIPLRPGMVVLDFGCGPGGYSLAAARLVEPQGCVHALDIHPLALRSVQRAAIKRGLAQLRAIWGGDLAELDRHSIDVILLYDVLHGLPEALPVLKEVRRVLKPKGVLSVSDHHLREEALLAAVTAEGYFRFASRGRWTYSFEPMEAKEEAT